MKRVWIIVPIAGVALLGIAALWRQQAPTAHGDDAIVVTRATGVPASAVSPVAAARRIAAVVPAPSQSPPAPSDGAPPLPAGLEDGFDPLAFARSVRSERRDAAWAPGAEAGLKSSIARVPYMGPQMKTVSSYCAATRCEVTGRLPVGVPMETINIAMQGLQDQRMTDMMIGLGLQPHGAAFSGDTFTIWTVRQPARPSR